MQIGVVTLDSGFGALPLDSKVDRLRRAYLGSNVRLVVLDDAHYSEQDIAADGNPTEHARTYNFPRASSIRNDSRSDGTSRK